MTDVYAPCLCGSGKKFKFCCQNIKEGVASTSSDCSKFPIYECKILENWETEGMTNLFVVREVTKNTYVLVSYLIDLWCLGLKDSFMKFGLSKAELINIYNQRGGLIAIPYEEARSIILGAVDFAKGIDIAPHKSWRGIASSFIEVDRPYQNTFTFGKDGKPFYFAGPYDDEEYNVPEIIKKVSKVGGHYACAL